MATERTHSVLSPDGTEIAGQVRGVGPPLVLVHGSLEDGQSCWQDMLPFLRERFTCYLPSTRGRGLSGDSTDFAPQRRLEDIVAFVDSIGQPVFLFGESDGGALALGAASRTDAVHAVAAYEPTVFEVADERLQATMEAIIPAVAHAIDHNNLTEAAEIFTSMIATDDEIAALSASGYFKEAGRYMPVFLGELEQDAASNDPGPTEPSHLATITVPTLLMYGSQTKLRDWFSRGVRHVAQHVSESETREISGAGHFGVALQPRAIAEHLTRFFTQVPTAA